MSSDSFGDLQVVEPISKHTLTAVMLHGRGSSGSEFAEDLFETRTGSDETLRDLLPGCRWIFPSAPEVYNAKFEEYMREWYSLQSLTDTDEDLANQVPGIKNSIEYVENIMKREAETMPSGNVILGGISQGWSIAILIALRSNIRLKCAFGFASWLPLHSNIERLLDELSDGKEPLEDMRGLVRQKIVNILGTDEDYTESVEPIHIYLGHEKDDNVVEVQHGRNMKTVLDRLGHDVTWEEHPGSMHWISEPDGMDGLKSFLQKFA